MRLLSSSSWSHESHPWPLSYRHYGNISIARIACGNGSVRAYMIVTWQLKALDKMISSIRTLVFAFHHPFGSSPSMLEFCRLYYPEL
jgi:hypothetical protein